MIRATVNGITLGMILGAFLYAGGNWYGEKLIKIEEKHAIQSMAGIPLDYTPPSEAP